MEPGPYYNFLLMMLVAGRQCTAYKFDVMPLARKLLHTAMNEAAALVLERGHLGMIVMDDDCFPPADAIPRLMEHAAAGHEFVAGAGIMRGYPHTTTIGRYFPEGISVCLPKNGGPAEYRGFEFIDDITKLPYGLVTEGVDFCGVPIAWIASSLLRRMQPPWFGTSMDGGEVTHDVFFAKKVQAAGGKVCVDTSIQCDHLAEPGVVSLKNRHMVRSLMQAVQKANTPAAGVSA